MSLADLTDAEVVARCRADDPAAWAALVDRYARYVNAIAIRVYRLAESDAEDVFQEVFARTYEHLDRLRDDAAVRPWIAQLTRRSCIDRLRHRSREADLPILEPGAADPAMERLEEALEVREALQQLPEHCREMLDRFFARDESYRAIGEALELPAGTIASRISRCLGRLREEIEGRSAGVRASGGT
jgi:RNA polymerase sigma-70 factor, ECF subfamily